MEREWKRKNIGGTVVGNQKIFCVKFADDVAIVADHEKGLSEILRELENHCDKNDLEVNTDKSKIIKFKKGGRRGKKQEWFFQRKKIGGSRKDQILGLHIHLNKFKKGPHKKPDDQGKEKSYGFDTSGAIYVSAYELFSPPYS